MELMFDCGIPDPDTQESLNWLSGDSNSQEEIFSKE